MCFRYEIRGSWLGLLLFCVVPREDGGVGCSFFASMPRAREAGVPISCDMMHVHK